ncbi:MULTISPECIES: sigma 54-interacting transcriptional regulator [unclassified Candidatus Accumulibacter]|uniref:sigma 54-interacting transcriptional regulator n=1 Tax=unclassified Candidatus Accumulibacter TaxID=2619054 RepID=UPI0025BDE7FF|nr:MULTISPECIES: sigma 54-interacting transcriptional regulator [unclassified Candidatus Accumulibacter]
MSSTNVQARIQVYRDGDTGDREVCDSYLFNEDKLIITIGSEPTNDIQLRDPHDHVSAQHAAIIRDPEQPTSGILRDLGSTNGTSIDDQGNPIDIQQWPFEGRTRAFVSTFRLDIDLTPEKGPWDRVMFENLPERAAAKPGFRSELSPLRPLAYPPQDLISLQVGHQERKTIVDALCGQFVRDHSWTEAMDLLARSVGDALNATNSVIRMQAEGGRISLPTDAPPINAPKAAGGEVAAGRYAVADRQMIVPLLDRSTEPPRVVGDWTLVRDVPNARSFTKNDAKFLTELAAWVLRMSTDHAHKKPTPSRRSRAWPLRVVGASEAFRKMMEEVHQAASSRITRVLLLGPTGVGKTFIAEEIHRLSRSSPEKFAAPNCGNPSAEAQYLELFGGLMMNFRETRLGAFEQADGGTVFLDEVHALAPETQQALKACMSEIGGTRMSFTPMATARKVTVDVRIISATDRTLEELVALGKFDSALLRRLRGDVITVPELAKRIGDIPMLAVCFLDEIAAADEDGAAPLRLTARARKALMGCNWFENVGALKAVIASAYARAKSRGHFGPVEDDNDGAKAGRVAGQKRTSGNYAPPPEHTPSGNSSSHRIFQRGFVGGVIDVYDLALPKQVHGDGATDVKAETLDERDLDHILIKLKELKGDHKRAASQLGISVTTLNQRLDNWCIPRCYGKTKPDLAPTDRAQKTRIENAMKALAEPRSRWSDSPKALAPFYLQVITELAAADFAVKDVEAFARRLDDLGIPRHFPWTTERVRQYIREQAPEARKKPGPAQPNPMLSC